jgi:hypothetical protein
MVGLAQPRKYGPWFACPGFVREARAGFLLSPVIDNRQSFFALASTNWQHELADREVTSARITADDGKEIASHYQSPPVRVRFYRLDFQRQDLGQRLEIPASRNAS